MNLKLIALILISTIANTAFAEHFVCDLKDGNVSNEAAIKVSKLNNAILYVYSDELISLTTCADASDCDENFFTNGVSPIDSIGIEVSANVDESKLTSKNEDTVSIQTIEFNKETLELSYQKIDKESKQIILDYILQCNKPQ